MTTLSYRSTTSACPRTGPLPSSACPTFGHKPERPCAACAGAGSFRGLVIAIRTDAVIGRRHSGC